MRTFGRSLAATPRFIWVLLVFIIYTKYCRCCWMGVVQCYPQQCFVHNELLDTTFSSSLRRNISYFGRKGVGWEDITRQIGITLPSMRLLLYVAVAMTSSGPLFRRPSDFVLHSHILDSPIISLADFQLASQASRPPVSDCLEHDAQIRSEKWPVRRHRPRNRGAAPSLDVIINIMPYH